MQSKVCRTLALLLLPALSAGCEGAAGNGAGDNGADTPVTADTTYPGTGGSFAFASYLGGSAYDVVRDIAVDSAGNAYFTGGTSSPNFPTTKGAVQRVHNPGTPDKSSIEKLDVFIVKVSPEGKVLWSTLLGGPNHDRAYGIVVDKQGFVYIAGRAGRGFPVTPGAFQPEFQGGEEAPTYGPEDGFVCKLKPDGSAVVYCSYFGTSDPRIIRDLAVNSKGEVYLASAWNKGDFPWSQGGRVFVNSPLGGRQDAVLAKIRADGGAVLWARYLGGNNLDSNQNSVALDGAEHPYMLFTTRSPDVSVSRDAYQTKYGGNGDVVISKLDPSSGALVWSTYFGGSGNESTETHELWVDRSGHAYVSTGTTTKTGFPTTANAFRRTFSGGQSDVFVAKFSPDGRSLVACTLIGGSGTDSSEGIAVDEAGNVFFTGMTTSPDFPTTTDRAQQRFGGDHDAMVVKLSPDLSRLEYSSYLGGTGFDYGRSAAVAPNGFYFGGESTSPDLHGVNAIQASFGGKPGDAFVARLRFEAK